MKNNKTNYKWLTQEEFENLEDGTIVEFIYGEFKDKKGNVCYKGSIHTFNKKDLETVQPGYFNKGRYRIKV